MASWYIKPRPRSKTHVIFVEVAVPTVGIQFLLSKQNMNPLLDFTGLPRFGKTTSHSTKLSAEKLLAGHPKDDSQVAGYAEIKPEHVAPAIEQLLAENRVLIARLLSD